MNALFTTVIAGLFFLVGALLAIFGKKKKGLIEFSIGMAFSVMVTLLAFHIVPEVTELLGDKTVFMYIFIVIGLILIKLIDMLVPHHNHEEESTHHNVHLKHIGIISLIALLIHNIIEGMGLYNMALLNIKSGLLMAVGIGLHNIPFGIEIAATLNETKKDKKSLILSLALLTFSTSLGAVLMLIFGNINNFVLGCLMSLTIGMVIYLIFFELLIELKASKNRKYSTIGIIAGLVFVLLNHLIGG